MRAPWIPLVASAGVALARPAFADGATPKVDPPPKEASAGYPSLLDRPHTIAQLEAGIIALPNAPIPPANRGGQTPIGAVGNGDATVQLGFHLLYRATREWAFGAGATFAPKPTSDPNYGVASGISRSHARSYMFLGGETRYFPFRSRWVEAWLGVTGGVVVIADRFTTDSAPPVPSILGTPTVTVSTEGFAIGAQLGVDYMVTDQVVLGLALRGDQWILPSQPNQNFFPFATEASCDTVGDCRTLSGGVRAFEIGVTFGYRLPL